MANLSARLERLEAQNTGGVHLFAWELSEGKATTVVGDRRYTQADDESRQAFLDRVESIASPGGKAVFLWVDELDARL